MQYQMAMEVKMKTQNSRQKYYSVSGQNTTLRQLIGNNSSEVRTAIFGSEIRKEQFALFFVRQTTQWSGSELCIYSLVCGTWQCKIWIGKIEILVLGSVDCAPFDWTLHWTAACMVLKSCFKVAIDTGRPRTYKILSKGKFYFIISTQNLDLPFTVFFYVNIVEAYFVQCFAHFFCCKRTTNEVGRRSWYSIYAWLSRTVWSVCTATSALRRPFVTSVVMWQGFSNPFKTHEHMSSYNKCRSEAEQINNNNNKKKKQHAIAVS